MKHTSYLLRIITALLGIALALVSASVLVNKGDAFAAAKIAVPALFSVFLVREMARAARASAAQSLDGQQARKKERLLLLCVGAVYAAIGLSAIWLSHSLTAIK